MKSKTCRLFLVIAVLMTILVLPQPTLAQERELDLSLALLPGYYYNEVTAGKDNTLFLEVRNIGSQTITNIILSSDEPGGWVIEFSPAEIGNLSPGAFWTVDVNIKPALEASRGEYRITLIAEADDIRRVETTWVTVKTASFWPWVGAGIALVVIAIFVFIFLRLGRQK